MVVAVSRGASGREYVCDGCGSAVAGIAVFRVLLGDAQAGRIWNSSPPAPEEGSLRTRCGFCFSVMSPRTSGAGSAAICRTCQVIWFDKAALESLTTPNSPLRLAQLGVVRCGSCGAGIASPLDHKCHYCGAAFSLEPQVVAAPARRHSRVSRDLVEVADLFARAVGAVLDWYPFS